MTEAELQAIEARANAATPGEWTVVNRGNGTASVGCPVPAGRRAIAMSPKYDLEDFLSVNGPFIAHARSDVPALVAEVRRLRAALVYVRRFLNPADHDTDFVDNALGAP